MNKSVEASRNIFRNNNKVTHIHIFRLLTERCSVRQTYELYNKWNYIYMGSLQNKKPNSQCNIDIIKNNYFNNPFHFNYMSFLKIPGY